MEVIAVIYRQMHFRHTHKMSVHKLRRLGLKWAILILVRKCLGGQQEKEEPEDDDLTLLEKNGAFFRLLLFLVYLR